MDGRPVPGVSPPAAGRPQPEEGERRRPAWDGPPVLRLAPGLEIPAAEVGWRFSASGGAGGQHVNTSNTKAEATFDIAASPTLPDWARERLLRAFGPSISVTASDTRSQARNRELALARLAHRMQGALEVRRSRRRTAPTVASRRRRLDAKRRRSQLKRDRRLPPDQGRD